MSEQYKPIDNESLLNTVADIVSNECEAGDVDTLKALLMYVPAQELLNLVRYDSWASPSVYNCPAMEQLDESDYAKSRES